MFEKRHFRVQVNRFSVLSSPDLQLGAARGYAPVEYVLAPLWEIWLGSLGAGWVLNDGKKPFGRFFGKEGRAEKGLAVD